MKTKWSFNSLSGGRAGGSLVQKMLVVSVIVALLAAFLPASSVFAAPAFVTEDDHLERDWGNKTSMLRSENLFYAQVRFFPADFEDSDELSRAYELLHKYGFALKQANAIVFMHAGFDERGRITDEDEAIQSLEDLAIYMQIMRGMRAKLDEEGYKISRLR